MSSPSLCNPQKPELPRGRQMKACIHDCAGRLCLSSIWTASRNGTLMPLTQNRSRMIRRLVDGPSSTPVQSESIGLEFMQLHSEEVS